MGRVPVHRDMCRRGTPFSPLPRRWPARCLSLRSRKKRRLRSRLFVFSSSLLCSVPCSPSVRRPAHLFRIRTLSFEDIIRIRRRFSKKQPLGSLSGAAVAICCFRFRRWPLLPIPLHISSLILPPPPPPPPPLFIALRHL